MADDAAPAGNSRSELAARGAANDALLFVGLGWISLLAGIGALLGITSDPRAGNSAFSVGAAGSLVLVSVGFWKFTRAWATPCKKTSSC